MEPPFWWLIFWPETASVAGTVQGAESIGLGEFIDSSGNNQVKNQVNNPVKLCCLPVAGPAPMDLNA